MRNAPHGASEREKKSLDAETEADGKELGDGHG
jgi:hypothetical protein